MKVAILILAAGRGTRFGGPVPKVFVACAGQPVLLHAARRCGAIAPGAPMVLAVHPDDEARFVDPMRTALRAAGIGNVVTGGASRQESMACAFAACPADTDVVLVHDGARPLFSVAAAREALTAAVDTGAAVLATPCTDTLKRADAQNRVTATVDRAGVWRALTPQAVRVDVLRRALAHAATTGFNGTDEASLVEHLGQPVVLVAERRHNLKITTQDDLTVAAALLGSERAGHARRE